jgi:hypothetical protein
MRPVIEALTMVIGGERERYGVANAIAPCVVTRTAERLFTAFDDLRTRRGDALRGGRAKPPSLV